MNQKNLFRRVMDAVVEGRMLQAQRFVENYSRAHRNDRGRQG